MRIHELRESGPLIAAMYRQVLQPSFPSSELVDLDEIQDIAACDTGSVWIAEDPGGIILGVAVAEWDADLRVLLLSYLAVRPGVRNGGVGGRLYAIALESWRNKFAPCVMITEIEDPAVHPAGVDHGDPVARQRFYLAHGGRILDLPYFQPALRPDAPRVSGLLLLVLHADPEFVGADDESINAEPLRKISGAIPGAVRRTRGSGRSVDGNVARSRPPYRYPRPHSARDCRLKFIAALHVH